MKRLATKDVIIFAMSYLVAMVVVANRFQHRNIKPKKEFIHPLEIQSIQHEIAITNKN